MRSLVVLVLTLGFLSGCATSKNMYEWSGYSGYLLSYYKNPGDIEKFSEKLSEAIQKAEAEKKVPPGMYAEYGYVLLELNRKDEAISFFIKERNLWPESVYFMDKLIARLKPEATPVQS